MTILIDLHYLPCLEYFACFEQYDNILIEAEEHYIKQSYRNRCYILTANKTEVLSVPVLGRSAKRKIKEVKIDYGQGWLNDHWRAIISAYGKSPFFEHYASYFQDIFFKRKHFLFELNWKLLSLCLKFLGMEKKIDWTTYYRTEVEPGILDLRSAIHHKKPYKKNGFYQPCTYPQVFGNNFVENLSILDLLFCEGPNARQIIKNSSLGSF